MLMRFDNRAAGRFLVRLTLALSLGLVALVGPHAAAAQDAGSGRSVAITFDDLPYAGPIAGTADGLTAAEVAELNARVLETLRRHSVPATGFVVEQTAEALGDQARPVLQAWTEGDFELGNHSYSHADVNHLDLIGFEQEIVRGEASIRPLMEAAGKPLRFVRFPMNHTGDTAEKRDGIAALLQRLGYVPAASTIDTSDYIFEAAYRAALRRSDLTCAQRIRSSYVEHTATQIDYYEALNTRVLGYAPPQIALLHLNRLNADALEDLLGLYLSRGYRFVTLEQAQQDPAFAAEGRFVSRYGPMWGYRWARERGVRVNGSEEAEPPEWLRRYAGSSGEPCGEG